MVAVDHGVFPGEVAEAGAVDKQGAAAVVAAVNVAFKKIEVVFRLGYRIVDYGVRAVEPAYHILALAHQRVKIHADGGDLPGAFLLGACGLGRVLFLVGLGHKFSAEAVVLLLVKPVFMNDGVELVSAEGEHAQKHHAQYGQKKSCLFFHLALLIKGCVYYTTDQGKKEEDS